MKYILKVYSIWEYGQRVDSDGNPHQEDSIFPAHGQQKETDRLFVLCDGMGGHDAGEVASATVCQALGSSILNDGHDAEGVFTDEDLKCAIRSAYDALDEKDTGAEKKMGTTMTLLKFHNAGATIAHIGDSRVYHIRPGVDGADTKILFVTEDHSLVNDLVKIGELTREEARHSKQKNVITRAMQPCMERRPNADVYHTFDIKSGDYFYMCSDGMLEQPDMESGESLKNIFSTKIESTKRKVEILTDVTEDNRDNHTALIIHVEKVIGGPTQQANKEVAAVSSKRMGIVEDVESAPEEVAHSTSDLVANDGTYDKRSTVSVNAKKKSVAKRNMSAKGLNPRGIIVIFIVIAIVAVACVLGLRYMSADSDRPERDKTELPNKPDGKRERYKENRQKLPQVQKQIPSKEATPEAASTNVAPSPTGETPAPATSPSPAGAPSATSTSVPNAAGAPSPQATVEAEESPTPTSEPVPDAEDIQHPATSEKVVDSDAQIILNDMQK